MGSLPVAVSLKTIRVYSRMGIIDAKFPANAVILAGDRET
jgi:hypothetical protein